MRIPIVLVEGKPTYSVALSANVTAHGAVTHLQHSKMYGYETGVLQYRLDLTLEDGSSLVLEGCSGYSEPATKVVSACVVADVAAYPVATTQDVTQLPWQSVEVAIDTQSSWGGTIGDIIPSGSGVAYRLLYTVDKGFVGFCSVYGGVDTQKFDNYLVWVNGVELVEYPSSKVLSIVSSVASQVVAGVYVGTRGLGEASMQYWSEETLNPVPIYVAAPRNNVNIYAYIAAVNGDPNDSFKINYTCGKAPLPSPVYASGTMTVWDENGNQLDQFEIEADLYLLSISAKLSATVGQASG